MLCNRGHEHANITLRLHTSCINVTFKTFERFSSDITALVDSKKYNSCLIFTFLKIEVSDYTTVAAPSEMTYICIS